MLTPALLFSSLFFSVIWTFWFSEVGFIASDRFKNECLTATRQGVIFIVLLFLVSETLFGVVLAMHIEEIGWDSFLDTMKIGLSTFG